jgi:hypothetical protein
LVDVLLVDRRRLGMKSGRRPHQRWPQHPEQDRSPQKCGTAPIGSDGGRQEFVLTASWNLAALHEPREVFQAYASKGGLLALSLLEVLLCCRENLRVSEAEPDKPREGNGHLLPPSERMPSDMRPT